MVRSSAVSWVLLGQTRPETSLTMAKEVVLYCLMMFSALATNHSSGIVITADGINMTAAIGKMQVWNATKISKMQKLGHWA